MLIMPVNFYSLKTVIKYKGNRNQRLTNCGGISDPSLPIYESYYNKNIKEETEYINNQLVYTAELQWSGPSLNNFKYMFSQCSNILSIDLNNFDTSSCTEMTAMFRGCSSLISINFNNFIVLRATLIGQMFYGCSSLTSLDLSYFRGTNVQHIDNMFYGCSSLVYLNFGNFNFINVIGMGNLFTGCTSLVSLYLPNFNTQNAQYMDKLFYNCQNLQYIYIPNVITTSADISNMFTGMPPNFVICYPLASASEIYNVIKNNPCIVRDCSGNWNSVLKKYSVNMKTCYNDCRVIYSYEYESKCYKPCPDGTLEHTSMFCKKCNITTKNCFGCSMLDTDDDLCISCKSGFYEIYNSSNISNYFKKCYQSPEGYYLDETEENGPFYKPCFNSCKTCEIKGNETRHNCRQCKPDYFYEIDYTDSNMNCYQTCEYYHYTNTQTRKSYCTETLKCPDEYIKLLTDKRECVKNCNYNISDFYYEYRKKCYKECPLGLAQPQNNSSTFCVPKYIYSLNNKSQLVIDIQEYLLNVFDGTEVEYGQDLEIQGDGIFIEITTPQNQILNEINSNKTTLNLGECENILRKNNEIYNKNEQFYIMKIDIEEEGMKIPIVDYEVYHPLKGENLQKLDLEQCKDTNVDISIPVKLSHELYKHNASDEYYNNKCIGTTSDNGTDICLKDRRNDFIEQNLTLCEENCILIDYNYETSRAKCNCQIKINLPPVDKVKIDKKEILKTFTDVKGFFTNIDVVKCYKTVFKKKIIMKNLGLLISVGVLLILIISFLLFYCKFYKKLKLQIFTIVLAIKNKYKFEKEKLPLNRKFNIPSKNSLRFKRAPKSNTHRIKESMAKKSEHLKNLPTSGNIFIKQEYKKILSYNDSEKNELSYEKAIKHDKRTFLQYYYSLLKIKNLFLFAFFPNRDYNSRIIKIFLFFFSFFTQLTINALYFTDDTMHKIYADHGKFDFLYNIPQTVMSSLISYGLDSLIGYLSLSEQDVILLKNAKKKKNSHKVDKIQKIILSKLSIKFAFFFLVSFIVVFGFGFYVTCFCGVYKNTQIHLITDTGISFGFSLITPFIINLFPGMLRIPSLRAKNKNRKLMYKLSTYFDLI